MKMTNYSDIEYGFSELLEKYEKAQKSSTTIGSNQKLIENNNAIYTLDQKSYQEKKVNH